MKTDWDGLRSRNKGDVFTFVAGPKSVLPFSFVADHSQRPDHLPPTPSRSCKRARPLSDVDDDVSSIRKKKRRLRLLLITSRLSRPFSSPPTHIVDRGTSKIAVWAKQKALGRNLLRKQAIMNRIRQITAATREEERRRMERARQAFMYTLPFEMYSQKAPTNTWVSRQQSSLVQIPRRQYLPLPPSPLGLSNYDALDLEDDWPDEEQDEEDSSDVNSDFNILDPSESVLDDYDSLEAVAKPLTAVPVSKVPHGKASEMVKERERQKEVSFVHLGGT
ncbi:MAG: hypothetical protein M1817_005700 [Caeruleum heppii]|nr:MAG: hypothetical protein M1817_005700 [Caeruleum heppii]